jgi:tetratricopeptide (TPR) repeat protein
MKKLVLITFFSLSFLTSAQNTILFEEGNALYNNGNYAAAIEKYLKIVDNGVHSAALYYNLGNAYYKSNQIAPSIYYYEKALQLDPNDADVQNNLLFAQNMTIDAMETLPQTGIAKLFENTINRLSYNHWATLSVIFMMFFATGFLVYYFSVYQNKKRLFFIMSLSFLLITVLSVVFAYHQYNVKKKEHPAIIFAKETSIKGEPNYRGEEVFLLHEGAKVNVEDTLGEWKKIAIPDGKIGWMLSEDLKEVKDF